MTATEQLIKSLEHVGGYLMTARPESQPEWLAYIPDLIAEADAAIDRARKEKLEPGFDSLLNEAARNLPDGFSITLEVERGSGWLQVIFHDGEGHAPAADPTESLSKQMLGAIALAKGKTGVQG